MSCVSHLKSPNIKWMIHSQENGSLSQTQIFSGDIGCLLLPSATVLLFLFTHNKANRVTRFFDKSVIEINLES